MPNLVPPVADAEEVQAYRGRIMDACGGDVFKPYMTAFFRSYTERELERLKDLVFGIKLYPAGATTNSEGGVKAMKDAEATMSMMQEMGIPLLVHGETHGFVMDRETEFLGIYRKLAEQYPRLTICMEHITTAAAVRLLDEFENLAATVTLPASSHHAGRRGGRHAAPPPVLQTHREKAGRPGSAAESRPVRTSPPHVRQ